MDCWKKYHNIEYAHKVMWEIPRYPSFHWWCKAATIVHCQAMVDSILTQSLLSGINDRNGLRPLGRLRTSCFTVYSRSVSSMDDVCPSLPARQTCCQQLSGMNMFTSFIWRLSKLDWIFCDSAIPASGSKKITLIFIQVEVRLLCLIYTLTV